MPTIGPITFGAPKGPVTPNAPFKQQPTGALPMGSAMPFNDAQLTQAFRADPDLAGIIDTIGGYAGGIAGWVKDHLANVDWGKVGGNILGFIKDHKTDILAAAQIANQAYRGAKADEYAGKAVKTTEDIYAEKKPLRDAGMAGMLKGGDAYKPDLSGLRAQATTGSGNPFAGARPPAGPLPMAGAPPAAPQAPNPLPPGTAPQMGRPPVPLPIDLGHQSGPIARGPQDRGPLPMAPANPAVPPMPGVVKPRLALPMGTPIDPNNPNGGVEPMLRAM